MTLLLPPGAALIVGGVPGAGKTTLLGRAAHDGTALVLDSAEVRDVLRGRLGRRVPYAVYRPLVHTVHLWRVWRVLGAAHGEVIVHDCATRAWVRRMALRRARHAGRPLFLLLLDVDASVARRGQHDRGRLVRRHAMRRHERRWQRLVTRHGSPAPSVALSREGFAAVWIVDRVVAGAIDAIRFAGRRGSPGGSAPAPGSAATVTAEPVTGPGRRPRSRR
jgi:predicted kinase